MTERDRDRETKRETEKEGREVVKGREKERKGEGREGD